VYEHEHIGEGEDSFVVYSAIILKISPCCPEKATMTVIIIFKAVIVMDIMGAIHLCMGRGDPTNPYTAVTHRDCKARTSKVIFDMLMTANK
jgi:hypothetical protein